MSQFTLTITAHTLASAASKVAMLATGDSVRLQGVTVEFTHAEITLLAQLATTVVAGSPLTLTVAPATPVATPATAKPAPAKPIAKPVAKPAVTIMAKPAAPATWGSLPPLPALPESGEWGGAGDDDDKEFYEQMAAATNVTVTASPGGPVNVAAADAALPKTFAEAVLGEAQQSRTVCPQGNACKDIPMGQDNRWLEKPAVDQFLRDAGVNTANRCYHLHPTGESSSRGALIACARNTQPGLQVPTCTYGCGGASVAGGPTQCAAASRPLDVNGHAIVTCGRTHLSDPLLFAVFRLCAFQQNHKYARQYEAWLVSKTSRASVDALYRSLGLIKDEEPRKKKIHHRRREVDADGWSLPVVAATAAATTADVAGVTAADAANDKVTAAATPKSAAPKPVKRTAEPMPNFSKEAAKLTSV